MSNKTAAKTTTPPVLLGPDRWVSCSAREFGDHVGSTRHIARPGALTTVCGCTATYPEIWRADSRKPYCPSCVRLYGRRENR
ncbi:hypothetical protein [Nocardioides sp. Leaf285]|uniref:hypothetical protein n=1 Tax=Nocardioides sp. Leaf285 TaxID=1736322 RepID=UPI000702A253|nr:hypothetical protein [Nocardioides sp. Leaf285]KQP63031.1 hypothetical protein ASF47_18645 [Nocardioides sp. Leaf285]